MTDFSPKIQLHRFADGGALAEALAATVADDLRAALAAGGRASLALSGGNTPKRFMQTLAAQALDWSGVTVTLVDERWVPESNARSNAALLRSHLLQGPAAAARFLPLYRDTPQPEDAAAELEDSLAPVLPLDVAVLGMGNDGHTASFFPGGDHLAEATDPDSAALVLPMRAPGAGEPRITLTLPVLLAASRLYLHIEGTDKQAVLQTATDGEGAGKDYPVRTVLTHVAKPLVVYTCP